MSVSASHGYIFGTIFFTVYSQLVMRWQVSIAGDAPASISEKFYFVIHLLLNPWIVSSVMATFFAGVSWMMAMTKFEISYAYPWISMNFVLIIALGVYFFGEAITVQKVFGSILVILGVFVVART